MSTEPGLGAEPEADEGTTAGGTTETSHLTDRANGAGTDGAEDDGRSAGTTASGDATDGDEGAGSVSGAAAGGDAGSGDGAGGQSEAAAELAAQRVERERIARRKAEKSAPIESGTKLSGKAADLLAAVRAVESGGKPATTVFAAPEPSPRPAAPAPEPVRRPQPAPAAAVPGTETIAAVRRVLADGGAPESLAPRVAAALGEGAATLLREDPWQLLRVTGVRPDQADGFARALLGAECGPDDERRGRAVTGWLLEQAAVAGHTALEMPALTAALARGAVPDPEAAVQAALAEGEALVFRDPLDPGAPEPEDDEEERPVRVLVALERYALAEESLADGLARLVNSLAKDASDPWEAAAAAAAGGAAELARAVAGHGLV
ncbi:helix-hairpin-helix domain-containing protein, partial [Streptomyces sp900105755]|uniref:helix-hairpin-helix domain-containing protein n=1 Tax=Streptomyces sp. 900105755 TaxID=3154389 RepID=UPI0033190F0F